MGCCWVFWWGFLRLQNIWRDYFGVKICFFTWGVTGLAPPELLILCCRSGALGFVGFDFTWISNSRLSFFASLFHLIGIGRIGLDFVRIRRICFHFIWIWGWLWDASSWGCPLPLFGSRLLHSDVICHPGCLWLYISTLIFITLILIFLWISHLSRVSSPVSWSMMRTQSFGGAGSVFPWRQQTQVRI